MHRINQIFHRQLCVRLGLSFVFFGVAFAQTPNMDAGLAGIVKSQKPGAVAQPPGSTGLSISYTSMAQLDPQGRVLVEIVLDGSVRIDQIRSTLLSLGASIAGENPQYRNGAISAYLPVGMIEVLGSTPGVNNLALGYKPIMSVGLVTSQGAKLMGSDILNNTKNIKGQGITVGVISDSFDTNTSASTHYAQDVSSGDLPTMKFVVDYPSGTDEGRAMAQIVYDVAPNSSLCFATAYGGLSTFAFNIRALRALSLCNADVIVDDVAYFSEPFFSDGQIAQAVNDVATLGTNKLPGKKVAYFSAAGNSQSQAFNASPAVFPKKTTIPGLNLTTISSCPNLTTGGTGVDTGGGFLNFGNNTFAVTVTGNNGSMVMQWDDPFDLSPGGITTDLNYLFFNGGNCAFILGANNFQTNQAIEILSGLNGTGQMVIARTSAGSRLANRVKLINLGGITSSIFGNANAPVIFGHTAAANAISVGAYRYTSPATQQSPFMPLFEYFSSPGPVTIAFDAAGKRLVYPETRKKPDLSAPDGVDTTFFGNYDYEGNGWPNFFGTSAAAPHAAGVAALLLQEAGGPGTLDPALLKSYMVTSIPARCLPLTTCATQTKEWSPFDGWGLLDANSSVTRSSSTTTLAINPTTVTAGNPVTVKTTVNGSLTAPGSVTLSAINTCAAGELQSVPVGIDPNVDLPFLSCGNGFVFNLYSSYQVIAHYNGDATLAPSDSPPVWVTVWFSWWLI